MLTFIDVNVFGAKIYCDPMNRYLIKVENHTNTLHPILWVNNQGWGVISYHIGSKKYKQAGKPNFQGHATMEEPAWTRERSGMFPSHLNFESPGKENYGHIIEFEGTILIKILKIIHP